MTRLWIYDVSNWNIICAVFYQPEAKKSIINKFVCKICQVLKQSILKAGKEEVTLTVTVRHMVSDISHWITTEETRAGRFTNQYSRNI